jgi:hypothetical protein
VWWSKVLAINGKDNSKSEIQGVLRSAQNDSIKTIANREK